MSRRSTGQNLVYTFFLTCMLFFAFVPSLLHAAPEIIVPGSVIFQIDNPESLPQDAREGSVLSTGYADFDRWLVEIEATSLRNEFGQYLPDLRVLRFPPDVPVAGILQHIRSYPFVVEADANYAFPTTQLTRTPSDPEVPGQWHHYAINSYRGWALAQGDEDVVVAIIDSGVDLDHPDLVNSIWVNPFEDLDGDGVWEPEDIDGLDNDDNGYIDDGIGWDFVTTMNVFPGDDPGPPDNDPDDFDGHGTHCSGDAAATTDNGIGVASPGWGCRIGALRAGWSQPDGLGVVGLMEASSAITYAIDQGFDVISMSFGGPGGDPFYFQQAMQTAYNEGLILVAAAGNESSNVPQYPAAEPIVVGVAATDQNDDLSDFSSYGDWVTIAAPGTAIYSTTQAGGYGQMGGTSMACPIVAGALAQAKSIAPVGWSGQDIVNRMIATARPIPAPGTGAGIVDLGGLLDMYVSVDSVWTYTGEIPHIIHGTPGTYGMRWQKYDQGALNVSLTLTCDEPRVTLGADSLWIGTVGEGNTGDFEVEVTVDPGDEEVEVIDVTARFRGTDFFNNEFDFEQTIPLRVGQAPVLVIDDDQGGTGRIDTWYLGSLQQIGVVAEVARRNEISVLADFIEGYDAIIYASGSRTTNHLAGDDVAVFEDFMNSGGKLLVSGQNIAEDLAVSNPIALDTLFHISLTESNANQLVVRGIEGQPISEGLYLFLAGEGGAWNQDNIDVLQALDIADPLFIFNEAQPERLAGVRVQEGARDLVFCSFGIEAINDDWAGASTRSQMLRRIFEAWGFETGVRESKEVNSLPSAFEVTSIWPNPTNGIVNAVVSLPAYGQIGVVFTNELGQEVDRFEQQVTPGRNLITWNIPGELSSGVYFMTVSHQANLQHRRIVYIK